MAIPQKIRNRTDEIVAALKECRSMSLNERDDLIEIMTEACEGANGLDLEAKTQANSQNIANLCYLFIREKLEGGGSRAGLYRLLFKCRHQITVIILGAFALLAFRPQFAEMLAAAANALK